jgi:hypothetical protein
MVEDGEVYYLIPGTLVRVTRDDPANGMAEILLGGLVKAVRTHTKFLTARPMHDIYGIVETPDTAGLIDPSDASGGRTPRWGADDGATDADNSLVALLFDEFS